MRRTNLFFYAAILIAMQASWSIAEPPTTGGGAGDWTSFLGSAAAPAKRAEAETDQWVVHEWGTFTTFSGSDGVYVDFRPLAGEKSDLPNFVLNRASKSTRSLFAKSKIRGKVRMETPVTYFYTDQIRHISVQVAFPQGLLTEFYPPVREMLPPFDESVAFSEGEPLGNSSLHWDNVTLIPISRLVPEIEDANLRAHVAQHLADSVLPRGSGDQHYSQARATDSALVHVRGAVGPDMGNWIQPQRDFIEKFLFYRGVGRFELPVRAVFSPDGQLTMQNDGPLPLDAAILIHVQSNTIRARTVGRIRPGESVVVEPTRKMTLEGLATVVKGILITQGLYEKEAASMVETWKQSWFAEEGTRVLYVVPQQTTDELLPLTVRPTPDETLRVLVGRMEIMSPEVERQLVNAVHKSSQDRTAYLAKPAEYRQQNAFPLAGPIHSFGRMTEPALVRVAKIAGDAAVRLEAERLISQLKSAQAN